jgi:hypothetical protein
MNFGVWIPDHVVVPRASIANRLAECVRPRVA